MWTKGQATYCLPRAWKKEVRTKVAAGPGGVCITLRKNWGRNEVGDDESESAGDTTKTEVTSSSFMVYVRDNMEDPQWVLEEK